MDVDCFKKGGKVLKQKQGGHRAVLKQHQSVVVNVHTTKKRTLKTTQGGHRAVKPVYQPQYAMQEPIFQHVIQRGYTPSFGIPQSIIRPVPNSNISFADLNAVPSVSEPTRNDARRSEPNEPNTPQKLSVPSLEYTPSYNFNPDYTNFIRPYPFEHEFDYDFDRETEIYNLVNQLPKQISFYDHESKEPVEESSSSANQPEAGAIDLNTIINRRAGLGINKVKEWVRNILKKPIPSNITGNDNLNQWLLQNSINLDWDSIPKPRVGRKPKI